MTQRPRCAVLVIDMVRDYFSPELWPDSVLPGLVDDLAAEINQLTVGARAARNPVIWVGQSFSPDLSDAFPHMRKSGRRYTIAGTPGALRLDSLVIGPDDHEMSKTRFSAFHRTELHEKLQSLGIDTVILAGITTSWCVRSTAVDAYQLGYDVIVVNDCVAGFNDLDHENALREMDGFICQVRPCRTVLVTFEGCR